MDSKKQNKSTQLIVNWAKRVTIITRLSWIKKKNRIKAPFFLGCVLINVVKHAKSESLIKKHFKRKHFSEICSEQILTKVKIYLHQMGHGGEL